MKIGLTTRILLAAIVAVQLAAPAGARAAETVEEILDAARKLDDGQRRWTDRKQTMQLRTWRQGTEQERLLAVYDRRSGDEERTISFMLAPEKLKGTAFLQWSLPRGESQQWLYLPELERTRRVGARNRGEFFMGSVLTYADLEVIANLQQWSAEQAPRRLVGEESVAGVACHVIEFEPRIDGIAYRRVRLWMERERLMPRRLALYGDDGAVEKTIDLDDVRTVGAIPTPHRVAVALAGDAGRSELVISGVQYDLGLAEDLFTTRHLVSGAP